MAKYLISFPGAAMVVPDGEWDAVVHDSHAVIQAAKDTGVYVFGGGIDAADCRCEQELRAFGYDPES